MEIVFLTGASGSGKTALLRSLEQTRPTAYDYNYFDSITVPSPDEMTRTFGSPEAWQRQATQLWVRTLERTHVGKRTILEGQMRLSFITEACRTNHVPSYRVILVDCNDEVRRHRLSERGNPSVLDQTMLDWASYLRDEARALDAAIVDTSVVDVQTSVNVLLNLICT